ncbi:MAG: metal ABC transporter substrate-binding protein [Clostridium sp.]|nr:metal ABC transporter substrate-binding protein [Clostridium sp.]MCM1398505.1 metal ABC transporter substrate-binding protein [Clostridium sp.]MCM1460227.1 metal ABC transporter substrate-binding protein [Bacteroides sp.]
MKKLIAVMMTICICIPLLACGSFAFTEDGKISIVCTGFSAYDWVRELCGDRLSDIDLKMLGDNGADMHSYQPSVEDIARIGNCDLFIYSGGESETWVNDALANSVNPDMLVINMVDVIGKHAIGHEDHDGHDDHEEEYDEHVWLSLKNACLIVAEIEAALEMLDSGHKEHYRERCEGYIKQLVSLDNRYQEMTAQAAGNTLIFGDRFPFRYLVNDYGIRYYAAFDGCSADTEASFEIITTLADKMDEWNVDYILVIEGSDKKLADTIKDNTKTGEKAVLVVDSIQSVSRKKIDGGYTYIGAMENNLSLFETALK